MKRFLSRTCLMGMSILAFSCFACGDHKKALDETRQYYKEMISLVGKSSAQIEAATDAKEVSHVIRAFVTERDVLLEKGKKLGAKYPDIRNDPALRDYEKSLETAMSDFSRSLRKAIRKYKDVKEFREAVKLFTPTHDEKSSN